MAEPLPLPAPPLTAPATLVPLLLLALVTTMGFTALGSFGTHPGKRQGRDWA
jgi:hypothetical protein